MNKNLKIDVYSFKTKSGKYLNLYPKLASASLDSKPKKAMMIKEDDYLNILDILDYSNGSIRQEQDERKINNNIDQVIFIATGKCQSKCSYCYAEDNINTDSCNTLTIDKIKESNLNCKSIRGITFLGGEPVLALDAIKEIIDYVNSETENKTHFYLSTGLYYSDKIWYKFLNFVKEYNLSFQISFDPMGENDRYCRVYKNLSEKESHDFALGRIKEAVQFIQNNNLNVKITVNGIFHKYCSFKKVKEWYRDLLDAGITESHISLKNETTDNSDEYTNLIKTEYKKYIDNYLDNLSKSEPLLGNATIFRVITYAPKKPLFNVLRMCGNGGSCVLLQNGKFSNCSGLNGTYDRIEDLTQEEIGLDKDYCVQCEFNNMCNGLCFSYKSKSLCWLTIYSFLRYTELFCELNDDDTIQEFIVDNSLIEIKGE